MNYWCICYKIKKNAGSIIYHSSVITQQCQCMKCMPAWFLVKAVYFIGNIQWWSQGHKSQGQGLEATRTRLITSSYIIHLSFGAFTMVQQIVKSFPIFCKWINSCLKLKVLTTNGSLRSTVCENTTLSCHSQICRYTCPWIFWGPMYTKPRTVPMETKTGDKIIYMQVIGKLTTYLVYAWQQSCNMFVISSEKSIRRLTLCIRQQTLECTL